MSFKEHFKKPDFVRNFIIMLAGIFGLGLFLSLLIEAGFGTDPCSFMNRNLASRFGLSLGNLQVLVNAAMFILCLIFARDLIGFGTFFNWICIGYIADFFCSVWLKTGLHDFIQLSGNLPFRILIFAFSIFSFVVCAAAYMNADMGLAPYDSLPVIVSRAVKKIPFFLLRICYDMLAISTGLIASFSNPQGIQGSLIGSIILALSIGPAVTIVGKLMKR